MKIQELRKKSKSEIEQLLKENREKLRQLRFDLAFNRLKNVREIRKVKKEIARILTINNQQQTTNNIKVNKQQTTDNKQY